PAEELEDTINAQPAILTVSVAGLESLHERLEAAGTCLEPLYVAGHSLGEYAALVAANALDFPDALRLVRERGRLMHETGERRPGGMAAVIGLDTAALERVVARAREAGEVVLANSTGQALHTADEIRRELAENVVKPVNWTRSVLEMVNGGGRTFVEVGPGKVLSGLIQRISNDVKAVNVQEFVAEHLPHGSAEAPVSAPVQGPISTRRRRTKS